MKKILNLLFTFPEYFVDFLRAVRWSKASPLCPQNSKLYYDIILLAHTVEKGLSVEKPRMKFGVAKITELLYLLDKYDESFDFFPVEKSIGSLKGYLELHQNHGFDLGSFGKNIELYVHRYTKMGITPRGGIKIVTSSIPSDLSFKESLLGRYSSRRYLKKAVTENLIQEVAEIIVRTPSQCNRQSARAHYFSDKEKILELLTLQGGANGFKEDVHNLFIITSEMPAWSGFKARSQSYVDGSLLAMQVMNACQAVGLDYCPLNLAVSNLKETKIARAANIRSSERLIMMISFGYPVEGESVVARSERISTQNILVKHT
jgi:nitroreductase